MSFLFSVYPGIKTWYHTHNSGIYLYIISIKHTVSAVFVAFRLVLPFQEGRISYGLHKNVIIVFYLCVLLANMENTKLCSIPNLGAILDEFQPRCTHETYSHKNEECITVAMKEPKNAQLVNQSDRASIDNKLRYYYYLLLTGTPLLLFFLL